MRLHSFPTRRSSDLLSALQAASLNRNEAIVRLLLDRGADVHAQGGEYGNALQAASFNGNEAIVRLLEKAMRERQDGDHGKGVAERGT